MTPAVLSVTDTAVYLGLSRRTVERLCAEHGAGTFPAPVVLSPGRRGFRVRDLDAWIDARQQPNRRTRRTTSTARSA